MKKEIKNLRVKIDGLAQLTKALNPCVGRELGNIERNSKEIEKAVDSLYLAKAWLGKVLGELGEATPYANDGNRKTIQDIEPTADKSIFKIGESTGAAITSSILAPNWSEYNHIEKVDWLREEINKVNVEIISKINYLFYNSKIQFENQYNINESGKIIKQHLSEARFWLGFELGKIKDKA